MVNVPRHCPFLAREQENPVKWVIIKHRWYEPVDAAIVAKDCR